MSHYSTGAVNTSVPPQKYSTFASSPFDATASFDGSTPAPPLTLVMVMGLSSPTAQTACRCKNKHRVHQKHDVHVRTSASLMLLSPHLTRDFFIPNQRHPAHSGSVLCFFLLHIQALDNCRVEKKNYETRGINRKLRCIQEVKRGRTVI